MDVGYYYDPDCGGCGSGCTSCAWASPDQYGRRSTLVAHICVPRMDLSPPPALSPPPVAPAPLAPPSPGPPTAYYASLSAQCPSGQAVLTAGECTIAAGYLGLPRSSNGFYSGNPFCFLYSGSDTNGQTVVLHTGFTQPRCPSTPRLLRFVWLAHKQNQPAGYPHP
jgi:hypothetical protein